ncbi:hypothetical protein RFI_18702 [Reticulomyxa filosa]|uniref:Uncharacterized protein n=1 Tax=Reticulomyxa filosa TaxID=46433 RepID=X6MZR7_RETFI|nr:hypothetical protein RFI_18702 [Reticulomyxa filosa]|eukprot:ETO18560.1 hypothetical protein RFI_18702 [Reticulomyxa filosa]
MDLKGVFVANPPNCNNLDRLHFSYPSFPNLKMERFGRVSKVIAEWDIRQANLKINRSKEINKAMQQLMAMQYAHQIDQIKSWDNYCDSTIFLQCFIRRGLDRITFLKQKNCILCIQTSHRLLKDTCKQRQNFLALVQHCRVLQASIRTYLCAQKMKLHRYENSIQTLQGIIKSFSVQKSHCILKQHTLCLQTSVRTRQCQFESLRILKATYQIQSYMTSSKARFEYLQHLQQIASCQAVIRAAFVRKTQAKCIQQRMQQLRDEILVLWAKTFTAFNYRAKFWCVFNTPTYLNLSIHCEELNRLQSLLNEMNKSPEKMQEQISRFEAERREFYFILKEKTPPSVLLSFYTTLNIDPKSKHKKAQLIDNIYHLETNPMTSATIILAACGSFPGCILDVTSQVELRRAERIRKNLMLTVKSSLQSLQALHRIATCQENANRRHSRYICHLHDELEIVQDIEKDLVEEQLQNSYPSQQGLLPSQASLASNDIYSADNQNTSKLMIQRRKKRFISSCFISRKSLDSVFSGWRVPSVQADGSKSSATNQVILEQQKQNENEDENQQNIAVRLYPIVE